MPKKTISREEILEKKRLAERKRKERIKNDPEKIAELRRRERERYHKKKADGRFIPLSEMTPRARRVQQKRNRRNFKAYYERQKEKLRAERTIRESKDATIIHKSIDAKSTPKDQSTPVYPPGSPNSCPSVSSINSLPQSPSPTLEPSSPRSDVSTNSTSLRREFNSKLRRYQRKKSREIMTLRKTIIKLQKDKDVLRKRCERLQRTIRSNPKRIIESDNNVVIRKKSPKDKRIRNLVKNFLEDDENSRLCPGKNDCITRNKLKKQKRYLSDSLKNLHVKYLESGNPPISYTTFTRLKPFWILQASLESRETCLCKLHANMDLLISCLKRNNIICENSTTDVLKTLTCDQTTVECLQRRCNECINKMLLYNEFDNSNSISCYVWQKGTKQYCKDNKTITTNIMEKVKKIYKPLELIKHFDGEITPFMTHCANMKNQYKSIKNIKENIMENECLLHIDFSENYNTKYGSEIQSVHFGASRSQLTLHTAIIYYHSNNKTNTQSFCTVSTSLRHDASSVWAHLIPILREIEMLVPKVRTVHIVSDSPSAQYRNKKVFYIMSQLQIYLPALSCVIWHYCECGHGKSAPDGIGGVLKRSADRLVAFGKDIIDINSFVQGLKSTVSNVKIEIVHEHEVIEKDWLFPDSLKPFSGSMKVHQVVWTKLSGDLAMRSLSCVEPVCLYDTIKCPHGKHLGFYRLPTQTVVQEEEELNVLPLRDARQIATGSNNVNICNQGPRIARFKSKSINKNDDNISIDFENIDCENLSVHTSFFENINTESLTKFENTKGEENDKFDDSDDDLNIF